MYDFIKTIISALQEWTKKEIKKNIKSVAIDMPSNIATTEDIQEAVNTINEDMQETINTIDGMQDTVDNKMDKENPAGTGSFSMNRRSGKTVGAYSHAVGYDTTASGEYSHAEGYYTLASGSNSHAEGYYTTASGEYSHAEGYFTTASGSNSHAEGTLTTASNTASHAEGSSTRASSQFQHVQGTYNIEDASNKYAHIVGNGNHQNRSNAHTLDWDGIGWYKGGLQIGGNGQDDGAKNVLLEGEALTLGGVEIKLPAGDYSYWNKIAYGNGKYIATNNSSTAAYSIDGINWEQVTLPTSANWKLVTYGNGVFVAIAYNGNVSIYSTDGVNWEQVTLPTSATWESVTYGNGVFVAIAYNSNVAIYSIDGINWEQVTLPTTAKWASVTYGNGVFVAIASGSNVSIYSTDGINWTKNTLPATDSWQTITYGNGVFVITSISQASSSNTLLYSTNGVNWTRKTKPKIPQCDAVAYGNGKFIGVGRADSSGVNPTNQIIYSEDGISWTQKTLPASAWWISITYGGEKFIAISRSGDVMLSEDGVAWRNTQDGFIQNNENKTNDIRKLLLDGYVTEEYVNEALANNAAKDAILYTEQELTEEQKMQARSNIGAYGFDWHFLGQYRGYVANIYPNMHITDWDTLLAVPSSTSSGSSAFASLVIDCKNLLTDSPSMIKTNIVKNFNSDMADLINAGISLSGVSFAYVYDSDIGNYNKYWFISLRYNQSSDRWTVTNLSNKNPTSSISVTIEAGQIIYDGVPTYPDTTLTLSGRSADAKAVGDALANHTHDDKYYTEAEVDALIASVANNEVFVITITKGEDGKYSADKTYDEIYNAYINKKELSLRYNDGEYDGIYPLNVYDGDSLFPGFAFEYHSVNGTRVFRRKFTISATAVSFNEVELSQNRIATVNTNATLTTTDKTLVGAINEINEKVNQESEAIPVPATATVGQTIAVKAVNENGKPTEWEAVNVPAGGASGEWKHIGKITTAEEVNSLTWTTFADGTPLKCKKFFILQNETTLPSGNNHIVLVDDENTSVEIGGVLSTKRSRIEIEKKANYLIGSRFAYNLTHALSDNNYNIGVHSGLEYSGSGIFTSILIGLNLSTNMLPVGFTCDVWGYVE